MPSHREFLEAAESLIEILDLPDAERVRITATKDTDGGHWRVDVTMNVPSSSKFGLHVNVSSRPAIQVMPAHGVLDLPRWPMASMPAGHGPRWTAVP
jgi:hypothetical protein